MRTESEGRIRASEVLDKKANEGGNSTDPLLKKLEATKARTLLEKEIAAAELAKAESQQKIAEANKATLAAEFPVGTAKPLEGTITTDEKFGYLAELIAYKALSNKIEEVATGIKNLKLSNPKFLMVDTMDFVLGDIELLQIRNQFDFYLKAMPEETEKTKEYIKPPAIDLQVTKDLLEEVAGLGGLKPLVAGLAGVGLAGVAPLIPGLVAAAADVVGYFQVNYDVKGRPVTPQNTSLQAMLAGRLAGSGIAIFFPNLHRIHSSQIVDKLKECLEKRIELAMVNSVLKTTKIAAILADRTKIEQEITALDGEIKKLKSPEDDAKIEEKTKLLNAKKAELTAKVAQPEEQQAARNDALIAAFDAFHAAITTIPSGKTYSPLAAAAMQEYYKEDAISHLLYLSATSAGGEAIIQKRFGRSGLVAYSGGGVITCALAETSGAVVYATSEVTYSCAAYDLGKPQEFKFQ